METATDKCQFCKTFVMRNLFYRGKKICVKCINSKGLQEEISHLKHETVVVK